MGKFLHQNQLPANAATDIQYISKCSVIVNYRHFLQSLLLVVYNYVGKKAVKYAKRKTTPAISTVSKYDKA